MRAACEQNSIRSGGAKCSSVEIASRTSVDAVPRLASPSVVGIRRTGARRARDRAACVVALTSQPSPRASSPGIDSRDVVSVVSEGPLKAAEAASDIDDVEWPSSVGRAMCRNLGVRPRVLEESSGVIRLVGERAQEPNRGGPVCERG
jgi:hypothetical protein